MFKKEKIQIKDWLDVSNLPNKLWERSSIANVLWAYKALSNGVTDKSCNSQLDILISSSETCQPNKRESYEPIMNFTSWSYILQFKTLLRYEQLEVWMENMILKNYQEHPFNYSVSQITITSTSYNFFSNFILGVSSCSLQPSM